MNNSYLLYEKTNKDFINNKYLSLINFKLEIIKQLADTEKKRRKKSYTKTKSELINE